MAHLSGEEENNTFPNRPEDPYQSTSTEDLIELGNILLSHGEFTPEVALILEALEQRQRQSKPDGNDVL